MAKHQVQPGSFEDLRLWFQQRLKDSAVQYQDQYHPYDGNTPYDLLYYQLQNEAAHYWQEHFGFAPTPGQISKAFFAAQFHRFRDQRRFNLSRKLRKLKCWLRFMALSVSGRI